MWKNIKQIVFIAVFMLLGITGGVYWGVAFNPGLIVSQVPKDAISCGERLVMVPTKTEGEFIPYIKPLAEGNRYSWFAAGNPVRIAGYSDFSNGRWIGGGEISVYFPKSSFFVVTPEKLDEMIDLGSNESYGFSDRVLVGDENAVWNMDYKVLFPLEGHPLFVNKKDFIKVATKSSNGLVFNAVVESADILSNLKLTGKRTPWLMPDGVYFKILSIFEYMILKFGVPLGILIYCLAAILIAGVWGAYNDASKRISGERKEIELAAIKDKFVDDPYKLAGAVEALEAKYNYSGGTLLAIIPLIIEISLMFFVVDNVGVFRGFRVGVHDLGMPENFGFGNLFGLLPGTYLPRGGFFAMSLAHLVSKFGDNRIDGLLNSRYLMFVLLVVLFGNRTLANIFVYMIYIVLKRLITQCFIYTERKQNLQIIATI